MGILQLAPSYVSIPCPLLTEGKVQHSQIADLFPIYGTLAILVASTLFKTLLDGLCPISKNQNVG